MSEDKKSTVDENENLDPHPSEEEMIPTKKVAVAARVSSMSLWSFSVINFVGLILIAGVAFFLGHFTSPEQLDDSLQQIKPGLKSLLPIMMTVISTIGGLLPIMVGHGTGSEVMKRIAAPMVGGMDTATVLTVIVIPAMYSLVLEYRFKKLASL